MSKIKIFLTAGCCVAIAGTAFSIAARNDLLDKIKTSSQINRIENGIIAADDAIIVKFKNDKSGFKVIKTEKGKVREKINEYLNRGDVEYAEPDYIAYALSVPNDPLYDPYQWNLMSSERGGIDAQDAWDISAGDNSVIVAVIDSGIAYENYSYFFSSKFCQAPDLAQTKFAAGYDYVNSDSHPNDDNGHGTHVAGTIAQSTNNGIGAAGIAGKTTLMPVKVLNNSGSGSYSNIAKGITYAADHGAKVINMSLGGSSSSEALLDAIKYAHNKGATIVAACGNENADGCLYPAAYSDYVISVGATRYDKTKAPYSNYGANLKIMAPGGDTSVDQNEDGKGDGIIQQTFSGKKNACNFNYYFYQGTSMAAPHISGIAALLIANGNAATPEGIETAILSSATDLGAPGRDNTYGWGLANAKKALEWGNAPECGNDNDCADTAYCNGQEKCIAGKCVAGTPVDCSSLNNPCNTGVCDESQKACVKKAKVDGADCGDGIFCNGNETCQAGECASGAPIVCDDGNECKIGTCDENNNICSYVKKDDDTLCTGGVCCSGSCQIGLAKCAAQTVCWNGANQYLDRATSQFKKFCKCAQGTYDYKSYKYSFAIKTAKGYSDTGNNENWAVSSKTSFSPVHSVICADNNPYLTNQTYVYPK